MTALNEASQVKRGRRTNAQLADIDDAIVAAVEADKPVTLRGVYYRAVSAGAVEKTEAGYQLVGRELLKLRRDGLVSYAAITDGSRYITKPRSWNDMRQALEDATASYRRAVWRDQRAQVHVFTEKDAISGVLYPVTSRWDVPLGALRGYSSESFAWEVAQSVCAAPGDVHIYQFGDHDPSGVDAWRSFTERGDCLRRRARRQPRRVAVTPEQIASMSLPTRPTKRTDSRAAGFAGESIEVDAIPARVLRQLAETAIKRHIDPEALRITMAAEASERDILTRLADSRGTETRE
jgi:hypothetical protein